ncbi:hypothetical protein RRG08_052642, partial [Elysia crispata]
MSNTLLPMYNRATLSCPSTIEQHSSPIYNKGNTLLPSTIEQHSPPIYNRRALSCPLKQSNTLSTFNR